jgi:large subunit ribosomal protein L31
MKQSIHPIWHDDCKVICACGNTHIVGSTKDEIRVEICSKCHPFFTGEMKFVDTLGRVEKFKAKKVFADSQAKVLAEKKKKKTDREETLRTQKSLKDMLAGLR